MAVWRRRRHALESMRRTLEVSHGVMFPLKLVAPLNTAGKATKGLRTAASAQHDRLLKSYATMCAPQPWHGTVVEEAARTVMHVLDPGGVPARDIPVEALGAPKHCRKSNERTENIS